MYANSEIENDHMLCMSRIWTILDRHSGYKLLIPIADDCRAEQCTRTYEVHLVPYIGYAKIILFNTHSLCMSHSVQAWAASEGILLFPLTAYQHQTDGQTEIVNKEVRSIDRTWELERNQWVKTLAEIQLKLNSIYNSSRSRSTFDSYWVCICRFGQAQIPYSLNRIFADTHRHV